MYAQFPQQNKLAVDSMYTECIVHLNDINNIQGKKKQRSQCQTKRNQVSFFRDFPHQKLCCGHFIKWILGYGALTFTKSKYLKTYHGHTDPQLAESLQL